MPIIFHPIQISDLKSRILLFFCFRLNHKLCFVQRWKTLKYVVGIESIVPLAGPAVLSQCVSEGANGPPRIARCLPSTESVCRNNAPLDLVNHAPRSEKARPFHSLHTLIRILHHDPSFSWKTPHPLNAFIYDPHFYLSSPRLMLRLLMWSELHVLSHVYICSLGSSKVK